MKKNIVLSIVFSIAVITSLVAQPAGQWMWIKGSNLANSPAVFGTQGVPAPGNTPPGIYECAEWTDLNGNFWLFGGVTSAGTYGALWKFDPVTNNWTWMKGPNAPSTTGIYGALGVPNAANYPPGRSYGAASWVDLNGDLWLFGGYGAGYYNDLWRYTIATNTWTWMKGSNVAGAVGVYGTQGVPNIANTPGSRAEFSAAWTDNVGNLWLFGGGYPTSYNDVWRYNIATNMWTWMKGSTTLNPPGVYGTLGVEAPANTPDGRQAYTHWVDGNGMLYMFGGRIVTTTTNYHNDLWRFNPTTNNWAWLGGSNALNSAGSYGTRCITSPSNMPPCRMESRSCLKDQNGNFWLFGGGEDAAGTFRNDLWKYCVQSNQWTWESGDNFAGATGNFGTINVPSPTNKPNGKFGASAWTDNNGHIFVFGGFGDAGWGRYNDMWKFTIDPSCGTACGTASISINTTSVNILCHGQCTGNATATPSGGTQPYTYSWSNGGNSQTISGLCAGNYSVSVTDATGLSAVSTVSVTEPPALTISASAQASVCPGACTNVSASGGGGTGTLNYSWTPNIGSGAGPLQVCPSSTTSYTVQVTDANGCTNTATATVNVNTPPPAVLTPAGPVPICTGSAVLHANTGAGYTYVWYFNGNLISGQSLDSLVISTTGDYYVVVTDANGCSSASTPVSVVQGQGPVITLSTSGGMCNAGVILIGWPGAPLIITASSTGAATWLWTPNGETTSSITATAGGLYSVMAWDANGCPSSGNDTITVVGVNVTCGHNGDKVILCHVPPGNPGNPQTICVAASAIPSHLANHPGDCVGPCSLYYAPRTNPEADPVVGDIEHAFYVNAYPNPFSGTFSLMIHSSMDSPINIKVYDMVGRIVEIYNEVNETTAIGSHLRGGMYMIEAEQEGFIQRLTIVKE
jgi:N-acetylneuraminic acid mutarotase